MNGFPGVTTADERLSATRPTQDVDFADGLALVQVAERLAVVFGLDEVAGEVQFLEGLASPDALDFGHVVQCKIQVFEFFQLVQILHFVDLVVLQQQDLNVSAEHVEVLDFFNVLLV